MAYKSKGDNNGKTRIFGEIFIKYNKDIFDIIYNGKE